jgi:hypothetical protein
MNFLSGLRKNFRDDDDENEEKKGKQKMKMKKEISPHVIVDVDVME